MESFCSSKSIFSGISKSYLEDNSFRERYYTYDPENNAAWKERMSKISKKNYRRNELTDALLKLNGSLGASNETLNNIEKLRNSNTLCVVTGQQTGILGGPLFTLYKASTTIKKAKELSKEYGVEVVPVFWLASEDHDFEEAREIALIDDDKLKKVKVDKKPGLGNNNAFKTSHNYSYLKEPVGWIDINTSVKSLMIEARHIWSDSEYESWCNDVFGSSAKEYETLSQWFARVYLKIFASEGLIIVDPMDKSIRDLGTEFLKSAIQKSDQVIQSVIVKGNALNQEGFKPLITPRDGATGLYYLERGERIPIIHEQGLYTVREGDEREAFCLDEIVKLVERHPEDFSTNVILRPVIQDVYFPTIAYVAGPGEASYYAQLKGVYEQFEMEMPIILPRENYTVCSERLKSELERLSLTLDDVINNDQLSVERSLLNEKDLLDVERLFDAFSTEFNDKYNALIETLTSIDTDILNISKKNQNLINQQFDYLKQKSQRFHRRNHKDELKSIKKVFDWIKPYGGLQERQLSLINILSVGGPDFVEFITNQTEYDRKHRIIVLE